MLKQYHQFVDRYGHLCFYITVLYPIVLPILMIRDTGMSLIAILRRLLKKDWKYLSGNDRKNGYNNLFYYTQDLAVRESGRYGVTPYFNGGNFPLSKLFHLTPVSLHFQASFGTVFMMFFAMCIWMISWIILYDGSWYLAAVLLLVMFSSLFYACFIEIQNYNILGWMLYPALLYCLVHGAVINTAIMIFMISLLSFTATIVAIPFVLIFAYNEPLLLAALIPGVLKIVIPILRSGQIKETLAVINGGKNVKFSRGDNKKLSMEKLYVFVMFGQFAVAFSWFNGLNELSIILIGTVLLFFINETYVRIADQQSFYILYLSVGTFVLMNSQINFVLLASFGLSIYLVYRWLLNVRTSKLLTPGIRVPFSAHAEIHHLQDFFRSVPKGEKVIMAYRNPNGDYGQIFNGYRIFNEPIQYAASLNGLKYMPDWYTIMSNNTEESPEDFWIETPDQAYTYMHEQSIFFIVVPYFIEKFIEDSRFQELNHYAFPIPGAPYSIRLFKCIQ